MHTSLSKVTILPISALSLIWVWTGYTNTHVWQKPWNKNSQASETHNLPLAGHTHYKYRNHAKHSVCISVTPCDPDRLNDWDKKIGGLIKHTSKFIKSTPTAMIREIKYDFGLGCHSISVEYHRRNAEALIHCMNHNSHRHNYITEKLLRSQIPS